MSLRKYAILVMRDGVYHGEMYHGGIRQTYNGPGIATTPVPLQWSAEKLPLFVKITKLQREARPNLRYSVIEVTDLITHD